MDYSNELQKIAGNFSILHAEDDEIVAKICNLLLTRYFKVADTAPDGEVALAKFKSNKYDILITDLNMPKMNGFELAKELRLINKDLPIMILSGYIQADMVEKFKEQGIYYLKKPFDAKKIIELLYEMCNKIQE